MPKVIPLTVQSGPFPAKALLTDLMALSTTGLNAAEMGRRIKSIDKITNAMDKVILDDKEYEIIRAALVADPGPFRVAHRDILTFANDVLNAPDE